MSQSALRRKETVAFAAARMDPEDIVPVTKGQTLCHLYKRRHLADGGARGCGRGWERVSNRGSFHSAKLNESAVGGGDGRVMAPSWGLRNG